MNEKELTTFSVLMNLLPSKEQKEFYQWRKNYIPDLGAKHLFANAATTVIYYEKWQLLKHQKIYDGQYRDLLKLRKDGNLDQYFLQDQNLIIFQDTSSDHSSGAIVVISPKTFQAFLTATFTGVNVPPAIQRLLTALISGLPLSKLAVLDNKSIDTIKRQAQDLRIRFGVGHSNDVMRIVASELSRAISNILNKDTLGNADYFREYIAKYFPASTRTHVFAGNLHHRLPTYKVLDLGPKNGKPIIVLHAMTLLDFRNCDLDLLNTLKLRLLIPLRNGFLGPEDPILSEDTQIAAALEQIDLISDVFCRSAITILCCSTSSKIAMHYIQEKKTAIRAIYFSSVCVTNSRKKSSKTRLADSLLSITDKDLNLLNYSLEYFRNKALSPTCFPEFIRSQFSNSEADSKVIEGELESHNGGERLRESLINSIASIRHDIGFQGDLAWDIATKYTLPMIFFHGQDNEINPPELIKKLVNKLDNAELLLFSEAGQLLSHEHFHIILKRIAEDLSACPRSFC